MRAKLIGTRKAIVASWMKTADALDAQGEVVLAADVRHFAAHMPPVLTDKERLAINFIRFRESRKSAKRDAEEPIRDRGDELTR